MTPETEEYLRKKYGRAVIGDAREEDVVEGMDPEELSPFNRRPLVATEAAPPLVAADVPLVDEVAEGREADEMARFRAGITNASKRMGSAITGGIYQPDYVKPEIGNEDRAAKRKADTQNFLLRKYQGDANVMNAEAARNNSLRVRTPTAAKTDELSDEKADALKARAEKDRAQAAKALRPPAGKAAKGPQILPTSALSELSDIDTAAEQLASLDADFRALEQNGTWAKYRAKASDSLGEQDGPAAVYAAKARLAMQGVGKILEGGKLAAGDEVKYREMLPKAGDSLDVLKAKVDGLRNFLRSIKTQRIKTYKAGGYRAPEEQGAQASSAVGLTPEEQAELAELEKEFGGAR